VCIIYRNDYGGDQGAHVRLHLSVGSSFTLSNPFGQQHGKSHSSFPPKTSHSPQRVTLQELAIPVAVPIAVPLAALEDNCLLHTETQNAALFSVVLTPISQKLSTGTQPPSLACFI
jgi:hypothetical protein